MLAKNSTQLRSLTWVISTQTLSPDSCFSESAIAGSWIQELEPATNPHTPMWHAGTLTGSFNVRPNTFTSELVALVAERPSDSKAETETEMWNSYYPWLHAPNIQNYSGWVQVEARRWELGNSSGVPYMDSQNTTVWTLAIQFVTQMTQHLG